MADANESVVLDIESLTLGDIEEAENIYGGPILSALQRGEFSGGILRALVAVIKKKTDPSFTPEMAKDVKLTAIGPPVTVDPTSAPVSAT